MSTTALSSKTRAEILFEEHFNQDTTIERFEADYPHLEIVNEQCLVLEGLGEICNTTGEGSAEVVDGETRFQNVRADIRYTQILTKERFKPSEGMKLRMSMESRSSGSPGNYEVGIVAGGNGGRFDLEFFAWPGFANPRGRCQAFGRPLETCEGFGQVSIRDPFSFAMRDFDDAGAEPNTPFFYSQNTYHKLVLEWDGDREWQYTLISGDDPQNDIFTAHYTHADLLPAPEDIRVGFANSENPNPNRGCGPALLCESWFDNLIVEEIPLLVLVKGDINNDGVVNFLDITPFVNAQSVEGKQDAFLLLTPDGCFLCADIDMDGAIDFLDITPFVNLLDQLAVAAVPEPTSAWLLILGLVSTWRRHRKRVCP